MIATKKQLERTEKQILASYAVLSSKSAGRKFKESEDQTRTCFQRDRDRIIHSKAFRRLSGKTQVFVATYGDHFRDRLSHTLETAQVARGLARNLRLNEDLCEVIALAHDLGHTPFGHAGEFALDKIMQKFGSHFEHNEQSKRIVEFLEKQFPHFDGLNLSFEVLQGLMKHQTLYDQNNHKITGKTLEAAVVDISDEIAYINHDLDDGLRSRLLTIKDLMKVKLWSEAVSAVQKKYGKFNLNAKLSAKILRTRAVSHIFSLMVEDVLNQTSKNIKKRKIRSVKDAMAEKKDLVGFSTAFKKKVSQLRKFLWDNMYQSKEVIKNSSRGQKIIEKLFWKLYKNPKLLPSRFYGRIKTEPLEVVVKDYMAGCTDQFATQAL
jgi:dGTPase